MSSLTAVVIDDVRFRRRSVFPKKRLKLKKEQLTDKKPIKELKIEKQDESAEKIKQQEAAAERKAKKAARVKAKKERLAAAKAKKEKEQTAVAAVLSERDEPVSEPLELSTDR